MQRIASGPTPEPVPAALAEEPVASDTTPDPVVAAAPADRVTAAGAVDGVVATQAGDDIVAGGADEDIGALRAETVTGWPRQVGARGGMFSVHSEKLKRAMRVAHSPPAPTNSLVYQKVQSSFGSTLMAL